MVTIQSVIALSLVGLLLIFYTFLWVKKYTLQKLRKYFLTKEEPKPSILHLYGQEGLI